MNGISIVSDTNPLIYLLNGSTIASDYLDEKQVWISVITELELFGKKGLTNADKENINELLEYCFIAELNSQIKQITKDLMQEFSIKLPDAIIAATALYLDLPLLTADTGFEKIQELKLILVEF